MNESTPQTPQQKESIRAEVVNQTLTLLTGGLSLVAALAWNEAVLGLFRELFPQGGGLAYKFGYALVVTAIIVIVTMRLRRLNQKSS